MERKDDVQVDELKRHIDTERHTERENVVEMGREKKNEERDIKGERGERERKSESENGDIKERQTHSRKRV